MLIKLGAVVRVEKGVRVLVVEIALGAQRSSSDSRAADSFLPPSSTVYQASAHHARAYWISLDPQGSRYRAILLAVCVPLWSQTTVKLTLESR